MVHTLPPGPSGALRLPAARVREGPPPACRQDPSPHRSPGGRRWASRLLHTEGVFQSLLSCSCRHGQSCENSKCLLQVSGNRSLQVGRIPLPPSVSIIRWNYFDLEAAFLRDPNSSKHKFIRESPTWGNRPENSDDFRLHLSMKYFKYDIKEHF